jgi:copper homeostasis protein
MSMRVAVVGGGLAGLAAARALRAEGVAVTLFADEFPFGGRFSPVAVDAPGVGRIPYDPLPTVLGPSEYPADALAAPLGFPPRSLRQELFPDPTGGELLDLPVRRISAPNGAPLAAGVVTLPVGGSRALVNRLLPRGCDNHYVLRTSTRVTALTPDGRGWRVHTREDDGTTRAVPADGVLLTQPVPDALALLDHSRVGIAEAVRDELARLTYAPAVSVLTAFGRTAPPLRDPFVVWDDSPIGALLNNAATGASAGTPALTALTTPRWAAEHFADSDEDVIRRLLPLITGWVGADPVGYAVFRRKYAAARTRMSMPFAEALDVPPLVVAGDAFAAYVGNPLDAMFTSAVHAAARLCRALSREARRAARAAPRTTTPVVVEATVASAEEALAAVWSGAQRLLLCAGPEVGGLTPTVDALELVREALRAQTRPVPVTALIRPRLGGDEYTAGEQTQMLRDARRLLGAGATGIAFGAVRTVSRQVRVDRAACEPLLALAREFDRETTFTLAFDTLADRTTGLQDLIALGFHRVYSAGGRTLAADGTHELAAAVNYAGWDIEVVPAGVGPGVVGYVAVETGCRQILIEARAATCDGAGGALPTFLRQNHRPLNIRAVAEAVSATRTNQVPAPEIGGVA